MDFNLEKLESLVKEHPETKFYFMVPPYSSLWWYEAYMCGDLDLNFYALEQTFTRLLAYENVEIQYFQTMEEIVSDLSLFMDLIHYHPDVNKRLVDLIAENEYKITMAQKIQSKKEVLDEAHETCTSDEEPELIYITAGPGAGKSSAERYFQKKYGEP